MSRGLDAQTLDRRVERRRPRAGSVGPMPGRETRGNELLGDPMSLEPWGGRGAESRVPPPRCCADIVEERHAPRAAKWGVAFANALLATQAHAQSDAESFGNPWMANLKELGPPEAVPWWPPAPGWYALAALLVLVILWVLSRALSRWRENAYRRQALIELERLERASAEGGASALAGLPALLKRTALAAYPRIEVAALHGEVWHEFLDGGLAPRSAGERATFVGGVGRSLDTVAYDPDPRLSTEEARRLLENARRWLRGHRRELPK